MTDTTLQLRRYTMREGELDAFIDWWSNSGLGEARRAYGFTIEFGYAVPETNEFVWGVSHEGDTAAFTEAETVYNASPERAAAFENNPNVVDGSLVHFVTRVV